jgi:hypothetical protein
MESLAEFAMIEDPWNEIPRNQSGKRGRKSSAISISFVDETAIVSS